MTTPQAFTLYPRKSWHPRNTRPMTPQGPPLEAFVHHSDDERGSAFDTLAKQQEHVRYFQTLHMVTMHDWSDIGYHYIIFPPNHRHTRAHIFEGRRVMYTPAAQENHNTRTLAICIVGNGGREPLHEHTRTAIRALVHKYPTVKKLGGHRDVVSTTCPGDLIYRELARQARILGIDHF